MAARIEHWSLHSRPLGQWQSPEDEGVCLFGSVVGHPRHRDGKEVLTTPVVECRANRIVTRSGSEYELGTADPSYERCYPGAFRRLLARLGQPTPEPAPSQESPRGQGTSLAKDLFKSLFARRK
jgi:hypothetical protein